MPLTAAQFLRRFRALIVAAWAIPPIFGLGFLVLVVELFERGEVAAMFTTLPLPVFCVVALVGAERYFVRFARPIVAHLEDPTDARWRSAAVARGRRFPLDFWLFFVVYLLLAPVAVMWSANLAYGFEPALIDWFRIELVSLVVSIIVGLPIFLRTIDLFGEAFAAIELRRAQVPITTKVFLIGALAPLLIDTVLVQYYWTATGFFSVGTFAVWVLLELIAIGGAVLAVRSFRQSLAPLRAAIRGGDMATVDVDALRPRSTDELGVLVASYRGLIDRIQNQNELLTRRNLLLRAGAGFDEVVSRVREVLAEVAGADDVALALVDGAALRVIAAGERGVDRGGHLVLTGARAEAVFDELREPDAPARFVARSDGGLDSELAALCGCEVALQGALRAEGELIGVAFAIYPRARGELAGRARGIFDELLREAAALLASSMARERHREAEARYQELTRFAPDALVVVDADLRVLQANEAAEALLGARVREAAELTSFVADDDARVAVRAQLKRALDDRDVTFESRLKKAAGGGVAVEIRARRLPGAAPQVIALIRDRSAQVALEEQLRHAQRMEGVGRLAGGVAHDFNNLLTVIMVASSLLEEELEGKQRAQLREIRDTAGRAAELTRKLLTFSRRQFAAPQVVDIDAAVSDAQRLLRRLVPSSIELTFDLQAGARVRIDRGELEQILVNLVVNARDALDDGGAIRVETSLLRIDRAGDVPPGDWIVIRVRDDGPGIPEALQRQIFEPYFSTKAVGKGTGLGLAMVYGFAVQAGGQVVVDSTVGVGSTFSIYLPRTLERMQATLRPEARAPARLGVRVLLVEDERAVREVVAQILRSVGAEVVAEASRGDEAVALAGDPSLAFDLVISDVIIPGLGGTEVVRRIRERRPDVRALLISGYADVATIEEISRSGLAFLAKPFTPAELVAALADALERG
ncbi:MAG: response regulator [Myxococcales bacterium]|nr:response regulator [Myxococcales bacterium]